MAKNDVEKTKVVAEAPVAEAETAVVAAEPKKRGRKPGTKTEKKEVAKAPKKAEVKNQEEVYIQYAGLEVTVDEIKSRAKAAYEAEGHKASSIKSLRLYIKPEENKAYYVINEKAAGCIEL